MSFIKYVQIALFEMAKSLKTEPIKLDEESYFSELSTSVLRNLEDFNLFSNFVEHELELEIIRAVKNSIMCEEFLKEVGDAL